MNWRVWPNAEDPVEGDICGDAGPAEGWCCPRPRPRPPRPRPRLRLDLASGSAVPQSVVAGSMSQLAIAGAEE
jgi:hypothetical protein